MFINKLPYQRIDALEAWKLARLSACSDEHVESELL